MHTHIFKGTTSVADNHTHEYLGVTNASTDTPRHIHIMQGFTTYDDHHIHTYYFSTGPSFEGPGGHYHIYRARTNLSQGHWHLITGITSTNHYEGR